jgi:peptidoglycan-associated lipoprotein
MRQPFLAVALLAVLPFAACKKTPPPAPPAPPPAAPATPPPAPQPSATETVPIEDEYTRLRNMDSAAIEQMGLLADIHFEYDKADIREADRPLLAKNAEALKKFDFLRITIEGHCDERGTVEYNLNLGERRSRAAHEYLVSLGVPADRLKTVSYGKEVPVCQQSNEECWGRNRRAHFAVTGKTTGSR